MKNVFKNICSCGSLYESSSEELDIYLSLDIDPPKKCPLCRYQNRLSLRNERTFYKVVATDTGNPTLSIFPPSVKFPIYTPDFWWGDKWDPLSFGFSYNFSNSFFAQFFELFNALPKASVNAPLSENCDYTNQAQRNKDCFMLFCCDNNRDCMYGMWLNSCVDCQDCTYLEHAELCYELFNSRDCYHCTFSENLSSSSDCHFSLGLVGCKDCFGCAHIRNKQYCFFNEQLDAKSYKEKLQGLRLDCYSSVLKIKEKTSEFFQKFPRKYYNGLSNENSSGDYLEHSRNAYDSYNCRNTEFIWHCQDAWSARNSVDLTETLEQDYCVEIEGCYQTNACAFSAKINQCANVFYSSHCNSSKDLFGCVGLRAKQYCILNKQYSKEEYFDLRARIVTQMRSNLEYSNHFPAKYSPFAYNTTVAQEYFQMNKDQVKSAGLFWHDEEDFLAGEATDLPDSIFDAEESILQKVIVCKDSGKNFKLQKKEFRFYQNLGIPIPRLHHDIRHKTRMGLRNPRKLNIISCTKCKLELQSTYQQSDKLLCEKCFNDFCLNL